MPGPAARLAALLWALLFALAPAAPAWARPVGTADGPGDVALAIGLTTVAAVATGLWLRSRYRREDTENAADAEDAADADHRPDHRSSGRSSGNTGSGDR
ncbi:hypothetical protein [Streptomyces sp. NBC_01408]|uniref:hypothetical protein n=1 Tax=Streptomyces sp. NBC_01408 TaxID=2903855 RepID=UPI00224E0F72|nr:hypothetical protein [Streptomyces sp. NBC_01408]MCX4691972.1 hypothetical protein [Streptomyces sp. NBC_01408]